MIGSFRHRGLKRMYERGDRSRVPGEHVLSRADLFVIIELTSSGAAIPAE